MAEQSVIYRVHSDLSSPWDEASLDEHLGREMVGPDDAAPLRHNVLNHLPDLDRAVLKKHLKVSQFPELRVQLP